MLTAKLHFVSGHIWFIFILLKSCLVHYVFNNKIFNYQEAQASAFLNLSLFYIKCLRGIKDFFKLSM